MDRVVEIIEAKRVFILISFIVVTFYIFWTTNSKLKQYSKQVSDLKIKLGSLEKKQSINSIDKKEEHISVKEIPRPVDENEILTYFKLAENWYGQNRQIIVRFNRGAHRGEMYSYNHDDVYDNTINYYRELPCWINDGYYSNGRNIPGNVLPYVTKIKK